jgi:chromosome segregation protein
MKLKKLEITGFKSFCDKSCIEFPEGVCAIVGPNGCGKSNIMDALRWVMGEQSVKQLRGKSMEDVIFAGANGKPPLNMAEVTLTIANDNGSAPEELKDYTEIMLTRRLFRSGESAYFLNKQPCRLKDIHNVFLGSGLGSKSYAIIQQGNIGAIIDAGPDERRYFIEEAAGTTRFKNRKTEALRKVESTRQNLLRVSDIITEIQRQMNGLKRQARKAERYKLYRKRVKALDTRLALLQYAAMTVRIDETDKLLSELKDADIEHTSQMKQLDSAVEEIKLKRWQKNQAISDRKSRKFDLQRNIDRMENDLKHLRHDIERLGTEVQELQQARGSLEQKNEIIGTEIEQAESENRRLNQDIAAVKESLQLENASTADIKARLDGLSDRLEQSKAALLEAMAQEARHKNIYQSTANNKENLKRRLKRADEEAVLARKKLEECRADETAAQQSLAESRQVLADLDAELASLRTRSGEKRTALSSQVKRVQTLDLERSNARSKLSTLKKMEENFEWYRDGVRAVMTSERFASGADAPGLPDGADRARRIIGLLADVIEPEPEYRTAVEAALGESLQYILVKDPDVGAEAIEYLQSTQAGRSGFIPVSAVMRIGEDRRLATDSANRLMNHLKVAAGYEKIVDYFLGEVVVVDTIAAALETFHRDGARLTTVTRDGDLITRQGVMIGGSKEKLSGILAKKQEIKDLEHRLQTLAAELETARKDQAALEAEARDIDSRLQQATERKTAANQEELNAEKRVYRVAEELKHAGRHLEIIELEQEQLLGEESDIDDELVKTNRALTELTAEITEAKDAVTERTRQVEAVRSELEAFNQKTVDLKLNLTALNARLENSSNSLRRLKEFLEDGRARLAAIGEDIRLKNQKIEQSSQKALANESALSGMYATLNELEATLAEDENDFSAIDTQLKDSDGAISELKTKREEIQEKIRLLELDQTQRRVKRENIEARLEEHYHQPFSEYADALKALLQEIEERTEPIPTDAIESELEDLRGKIASIGDVNLGAINEYEQLKSRHEFLCEQRDDLEKAIEALQKVIKKINRITQERFIETFNFVNQKLQQVFPRLFEGGSAKLVLTDPTNPLETGVEYMIHPPGKKLTRMSLLSGGEKALAAIAFIFSLFLIKPTAFCLMDEIDAPLDEANVYRFNNLLKLIGENSQIVMVTHNKKSMEFADILFGITMENKGVSKVVAVNLHRKAA